MSVGRYASLDLASHVGDRPADVEANRSMVAAVIGRSVGDFAWMDQVHGVRVGIVDAHHRGPFASADALVTVAPNVVLAVLVADCVPLLAADAQAGVIAVAHAGRLGAAAGVQTEVVRAMVALGADVQRTAITLGPAICGRCYEVPAAMRDEVDAALPGAAATTSQGTPGLDLRAGLRRQLLEFGVRSIRVDPRCTFTDRDLYSHRRATLSSDGAPTGRFAGLTWLEGAGPSPSGTNEQRNGVSQRGSADSRR